MTISSDTLQTIHTYGGWCFLECMFVTGDSTRILHFPYIRTYKNMLVTCVY